MRTNGERRPDEIQAEIERTRGEMDRTLSAIEQRLTPGQLVDQGMDYLRHSGATEFAQNLGGAAKQNPLPVALAGIGIAWLMALGRQPAQHQGYGAQWTSGSSASSGPGMRESMSSMKDRANEKIGAMKDRASGTMQSASESYNSARQRLSGTMSSVADTTRQQYERARGSLDYLVNEQPLLLGAIGLAIGAALGAAAPRTRKEEEMMGEASRNLMEKAKETGSQQLEKAKEIGSQQLEKAKDAVKQSTSPQQGQQHGQSSQRQGQHSSQHDGKGQQQSGGQSSSSVGQHISSQQQQGSQQSKPHVRAQTGSTPEKKGGW